MITKKLSTFKTVIPTLTGIILGTCLTLGITTIAAQVNNTTINACYRNNNGALRILQSNESCDGNETPISWNQQGPQGPIGPTGPTGVGGLFPVFCPFCEPGGNIRNILSGKDLSNSYLFGARFEDVNLSNSNLSNVDLSDAFLGNANLTNTNLNSAKFVATDFINTNMANSDATNATFESSNLSQAILTGITWSNTICPDGTNSDNNGNTCEGHLVP